MQATYFICTLFSYLLDATLARYLLWLCVRPYARLSVTSRCSIETSRRLEQRNVLRDHRPAERRGWVFRPNRNCALHVEGVHRCPGILFNATRAATWKLRLPSSVALLSAARSPRPAER